MSIDIVTLAMANSYTKKKIEEISLESGPPGPQGEPGAPGYTPVKGIDYFTEADKIELVDAVLAALPAAEGVGY